MISIMSKNNFLMRITNLLKKAGITKFAHAKLAHAKFALVLAIAMLAFSIATPSAHAYVVKYKEDYYRLYHVHHQQFPEDCLENIYWLEKAVSADFANPYYAFTKVETEREWEKYRYLFQMHLNLKLIEQHLRMARIYDKKAAYFYDAPWKDEYLRNLKQAKAYYQAGYYYWQEAKLWAEKANTSQFNFLYITSLQNWEDERERIVTEQLNYKAILDRELTRLQKVIDDLEAMTQKSY